MFLSFAETVWAWWAFVTQFYFNPLALVSWPNISQFSSLVIRGSTFLSNMNSPIAGFRVSKIVKSSVGLQAWWSAHLEDFFPSFLSAFTPLSSFEAFASGQIDLLLRDMVKVMREWGYWTTTAVLATLKQGVGWCTYLFSNIRTHSAARDNHSLDRLRWKAQCSHPLKDMKTLLLRQTYCSIWKTSFEITVTKMNLGKTHFSLIAAASQPSSRAKIINEQKGFIVNGILR